MILNKINKKKLLDKILDYKYYYIVIAISVIAFLCIFGPYVINPLYSDWLLSGGDLSQHYLGWKAFLNSSWKFPIGLTDQLKYPHNTSIIFTDSIPLFAIFFKLFKFCLPTNFQYFGLWGLLSFILMGVFGYKITFKITKNVLCSTLLSTFYILTPCFIGRMYAHTALAGQWIILISIDFLILVVKNEISLKNLIIKSALIGALATSIHFYFVPMCFAILIGICLFLILKNKNAYSLLHILFPYVCSFIIVFALLGGFSSINVASADGYGIYSSNLNCFINPMGWSLFLKDMAQNSGQHEGNAYLGLGFLILFAIVLILFLINNNLIKFFKQKYKIIIPILAIMFFVSVYAFSNIVVFNTTTIISVKLPSFMMKLFNIFRASGRFIWVDVYIIYVLTAYMISKIYNFKTIKNQKIINISIPLIISCCCALNIADLSKGFSSRFNTFALKKEFQTELKESKFWNQIAHDSSLKHIILTEDFNKLRQSNEKLAWSIANYTLNNKKTLNSFYLARDDNSFNKYLKDFLENPKDSYVYISTENTKFSITGDLKNTYFIDGLYISTSKLLDQYTPVSSISPYKYKFNNQYIQNGYDKNNVRTLYQNGISFGPYIPINKGEYHITVKGNNLSNCDYRFTADYGTKYYDLRNKTISNNETSYDVVLNEMNFNCETTIENKNTSNVLIEDITITKIA